MGITPRHLSSPLSSAPARRVRLGLLAAWLFFGSGCPQAPPPGMPDVPIPYVPRPPQCTWLPTVTVDLLIFDNGWLAPDVLGLVGHVVLMKPVAEKRTWDAGCHVIGTTTETDLSYRLWYQAPGKAPVDVTPSLVFIRPDEPSFMPQAGTYYAQVKYNGNNNGFPTTATRRIVVAAQCGDWVSVGPNANTPQASSSNPNTGRVYAVAIDPTNTDRWYAGAAHGGIWRSDSAGKYWYPLNNTASTVPLQAGGTAGLPQGLSVGRIAVGPRLDPQDAFGIVYASPYHPGSGDWYRNTPSPLLYSTTGGETWTNCGALPGLGVGDGVIRLLLDPLTPGTVYALTFNNFYVSTNYCGSWTEKGLDPAPSGYSDMAVVAYNNDTHVFLALRSNDTSLCTRVLACDGAANLGAGCWHATGITFNLNCPQVTVNPSPYWIKLSVVPDPNHNYRAYAVTPRPPVNGVSTTIRVYSLQGDGQHWVTQTDLTHNFFGLQNTNYTLQVAANPNDPDDVSVGGQHVTRSADGGGIWFETPTMHVDIHALLYSPQKGLLIAGDDGGIEAQDNTSFNPDAPWIPLNYGMETMMFNGLAIQPDLLNKSPLGMLAGTQDNGGFYRTTGRLWDTVAPGDVAGVALNHSFWMEFFSPNTDGANNWVFRSKVAGGWPFDTLGWTTSLSRDYGASYLGHPHVTGSLVNIGTNHQLQQIDNAELANVAGMPPVASKCIDPTPTTTTDSVQVVKPLWPDGNGQGFYRYLAATATAQQPWSIYLYGVVLNPAVVDCGNAYQVANANNVVVMRSITLNQQRYQGARVLDVTPDLADPDQAFAVTDGAPPTNVIRLVRSGQNGWTPVDVGRNLTSLNRFTPTSTGVEGQRYAIAAIDEDHLMLGSPNGMYRGTRLVANDDTFWSWEQDPSFPPAPVTALQRLPTGQLRASTFGRGAWETFFCKDGFPWGPVNTPSWINPAILNAKVFPLSATTTVGVSYYLDGGAAATAQITVLPTQNGVTHPSFTNSSAQAVGGSSLTTIGLTYLGNANSVLVTDGLKAQLTSVGGVVAEVDVPMVAGWRPAGSSSIYLDAKGTGMDGGPFDVPIVFAVTDSSQSQTVAPGSHYLGVPHDNVTLVAPSTVNTDDGTAEFIGWTATGEDASNHAGLTTADFTALQITVTLEQDLALRASYRVVR